MLVRSRPSSREGEEPVFTFQLVPRVHYGAGAAQEAGPALKGLKAQHVLVISDKGVLQAGVCDSVLASVKSAGIRTTLFADLQTNPTDTSVMAAVSAYRESGADSLLAIGGGSALDVAKSVAAVVTGGGSIHEYEDGARTAVGPHPPLVLVPTTAGTGSEAVGGTIITDTTRQFKMHIVAVPGDVALVDPLLTESLPPFLTAATGLDALSHAIGAFVSVERQPLADANALYAIELIQQYLMRAVKDGQDREARAQMMVAALTAGISMKGGGCADHAFAHGVNALHHVHHGVGCAIFLAPVMAYNLPAMPERYARIATALGVDTRGMSPLEAGQAGIDLVAALVREAGIPTLRNLGVKESDLERLTDYVMADQFHLGLNPVPITRADAEAILRQTLAG